MADIFFEYKIFYFYPLYRRHYFIFLPIAVRDEPF
jgi:hypothetical protein